MANQLGLLSYNNQTMTTHCSSKPTPGGFWTSRILDEENLHIIPNYILIFPSLLMIHNVHHGCFIYTCLNLKQYDLLCSAHWMFNGEV